MPKTKKQYAEIRNKSEAKILDAALELFATQGYQATSISNIAQSAGVSKGLMYNYFESKTALLRSIIINAEEIGTGFIKKAIEEESTPEGELRQLVLNLIDHLRNNMNYWRLLTALAFQKEVMNEVQDIIDQNTAWHIQKGIEIFEKMGAKNAFEEALLFGATLDGIILHYMHMKDLYPLDQMAERLINTYCNITIYSNIDKNEIE